jgi:IS30 family transposase
MREYRQLTEEDRIEIYAMKQAGKKQNRIAATLGVAPSRDLKVGLTLSLFKIGCSGI